MRKRRMTTLALLVVLLTFSFAGTAWAPGHVPVDHVLVAHHGFALEVPRQALDAHLDHGDFQLPVCDFNNIYLRGDDVSHLSDSTGDGFVDNLPNPRDDASGVTPACPEGKF